MKPSPSLLIAILFVISSGVFAESGPSESPLGSRTQYADESAFAGITRPRLVEDLKIGEPGNLPSAVVTVERQVFQLLNAKREEKGLEPLAWSDAVASVARVHSRDMAANKFFSHKGRDGSMVDDRADKMGLGGWSAIGENIAYMRGFKNPAETAVEQWMLSPKHKENLLGARWKESAVGVAITEDGTYYFTQVFIVRN